MPPWGGGGSHTKKTGMFVVTYRGERAVFFEHRTILIILHCFNCYSEVCRHDMRLDIFFKDLRCRQRQN